MPIQYITVLCPRHTNQLVAQRFLRGSSHGCSIPSLWSALPTRFSTKHHRSQSSRFCATPLRSNSLRSCAIATHVISLHYRYGSFLRQSPPCRRSAYLCFAYTVPSKTSASHFNAEAVHYISQPSPLSSELYLSQAIPCQCDAMVCRRNAKPFLSRSTQFITFPQPFPSVHHLNISELNLTRQCRRDASQIMAFAHRDFALALPGHAMPSHYRATPFPRRTMRNLTVTLPCVTSPALRFLPR